MSLPDAVSRRRRKWILPHLRGRMALWLVAAPALRATTAAWAALFLLWSPILDQAIWSTRGANPHRMFWDVCLRILLTTGALAVIFGIVALVAARIVSHRVAGPLHRMGEVAVQVAKGATTSESGCGTETTLRISPRSSTTCWIASRRVRVFIATE